MVSTTKAVSTALSLASGDVVKFAGALKNLSPAMIDQLVKSGQLSQAKVLEALDTAALTEEEKKAIKVRIVDTTTTTGAAGATKLFDFSLKGLWATMKAFAVAHPAITTIAAIAAVAALVAGAIDWANTSIDEHNARLEELQSEASELQSELDSLNQELDTFADRLDELRNKKVAGTLTLVEKSELEDLERRNQLLQQYKDLIQDDLDANTAEKLSHAGAVLGGKYSALAWSQDPFAASAGPKELVAGDSATAPEILAAHAKLLQDLQAQEETFIQQYNNGEITKPILDEWRANIESRRNAIKNDTKILIQDLSASAKAVIDSGVTSGAEFDLAKEFLDAVEQWQLVDATVTEKIAYLAKNAPEAVKKIASQADGVLTEAKVAASESLQDFVNLAIQLGVIPDDSAESLAALTAAIADVGKTAASSGSEVKTFESIVSSLSSGIGAIASAQEDMAKTGYLSADSIKALKDAGLEKYLVACEGGYKLAYGALDDYIQLEREQYDFAFDEATEAAQRIVDAEALKAQGIDATTASLEMQMETMRAIANMDAIRIENEVMDEYRTNFSGLDESEIAEIAYNDPRVVAAMQKSKQIRQAYQDYLTAKTNKENYDRAYQTAWRDLQSGDTTDKNKSEFEELYDQWKHKLDMGKATLKEFNNWLDGNDGYKKYFSDRTKYADEWRKYEKEVFENSMQLHEQEATNLDHTIEMLTLQGKSEQDILEVYRQKQALLENARDLVYDFLKAQGLSEEQINSNSTFQELSKSLIENRDSAKDFYKERVDQRIADFEHEINLLERLEGQEDELIAKYREEQAYLVSVREEYRKTLVAAGKTADEIVKDDWFQELTEQIHDVNDAIDDVFQDVFDRISGDLNELLDLTKELIQHEKEEQIEALEDQKDIFSELIDSKKEMLRLTREEQEYNDKVAESTKSIAKLQSRIDALALDDSRQAALERGKLEEELAELQKELADTQNDHYITKTEEALDKEEEEYHDLMDAKIKDIENFLDDNEAMTNAALQRLDNANETLFDQLESYAKHYTDTTGAELKNMWDTAMKAAEKYGSFTNSMTMFEESDVQNEAQRIVAEMHHNGDMWAANPDPASRKKYDEANLDLGAQLEELLGVTVERINGTWYIGDGANRKKLYEVFGYHTGGVVGDTTSISPKADELFALLQDDEVVMSRRMVSNTFDFLTGLPKVMASAFRAPLSLASQAVGGAKEYILHISAPLNMDGVLPKDEILSTIKQYPRRVAELVASEIQKL